MSTEVSLTMAIMVFIMGLFITEFTMLFTTAAFVTVYITAEELELEAVESVEAEWAVAAAADTEIINYLLARLNI